MQPWMPVLAVCLGAFTIAGAVSDANWFMENRRATLLVGLFGRGGARGVYVAIGLFFVVLGVLMFFDPSGR